MSVKIIMLVKLVLHPLLISWTHELWLVAWTSGTPVHQQLICLWTHATHYGWLVAWSKWVIKEWFSNNYVSCAYESLELHFYHVFLSCRAKDFLKCYKCSVQLFHDKLLYLFIYILIESANGEVHVNIKVRRDKDKDGS